MASCDVQLFVYDLSKGLAKQLSLPLIGKHLDGIWHTSIVIFNREYFFGGGGIQSCRPCGTILGEPDKAITLGQTQVTYSIFLEYLHELGDEKYRGEMYNLFEFNCNTFSSEVASFLTGSKIPDYITALPQEVMNTPIGAMLKNIVDSMTSNPIAKAGAKLPTFDPAVNGITEGENKSTESAAKGSDGVEKEPSASGKSKEESVSSATGNAAAESSENVEDALMERIRKERLQERAKLVLFEEVNPVACVEAIKSSLPKGLLSDEEITELENLVPCLLGREGGEDLYKPTITPAGFLVLGKLMCTVELPPEILHPLVDILQLVFLDPEIIREQKENDDHAIMTFIFLLQTYALEVQVSIFRMLCNACSTRKGSLWLKSEKEWMCPVDGQLTSNMQLITSLIVASLLSTVMDLIGASATLVWNMSRYNISDDFTVEVSSALIQCLTMELTEEATYRCLQALFGLMQYGEVASLMKVMGVDTIRYSTMSERVAEVCRKIEDAMEM